MSAWNNGKTPYCHICGFEFMPGDSLTDHIRLEHEELYHNAILECVPGLLKYLEQFVTNDLNETLPVKYPNLYEKYSKKENEKGD